MSLTARLKPEDRALKCPSATERTAKMLKTHRIKVSSSSFGPQISHLTSPLIREQEGDATIGGGDLKFNLLMFMSDRLRWGGIIPWDRRSCEESSGD